MNYYNPYFIPVRPSLFGSLRSTFGNNGITLGGILNGTQRTLNIINQAIPIVKQVQPVMKNARTMFKVMNEFKKTEPNTNNNTNKNFQRTTQNKKEDNVYEQSYKEYEEGPTFFM
mgnify:FL=1